jgi:Protein of unknown function (DUF2809)
VRVSRLIVAGAGAAILAAGLAVRSVTGGAFAKGAGDALYAALVYAIVVFIAPRARPVLAGAVAVGLCWAIEFAQLTPVPAALSAHGTLPRLVFGTTFHAADLFWYVVGIAPLVAVTPLARRR